MSNEFAVVDLFAGPGGLGEGFSAFRTESGARPFKIRLSVENATEAHQTLLLRSFLRQFENEFPPEYYDFLAGDDEPNWNVLYPKEWRAANKEALRLKIGSGDSREELNGTLDKIRREYDGRIIVIGGPPCQAYSLVGRVRNSGNKDYKAGEDARYFLYKEYASVVGRLRPIAFIMENVKGILSAKLDGERVFPTILDSLSNAGDKNNYKLFSVGSNERNQSANHDTDGRKYVIRSENFGIPQCRHRVIVAGIRSDLVDNSGADILFRIETAPRTPTVEQLIAGMPPLRSGLKLETPGNSDEWARAVQSQSQIVINACKHLPPEIAKPVKAAVKRCASKVKKGTKLRRKSSQAPSKSSNLPNELSGWIEDSLLQGISNHDTRAHMESDLGRYLFVSAFAEITGRSPKSSDFPTSLAPNHKNWSSGKFADRFRVQIWNGLATTVTSHISKDGHANIHPDPEQCRSLTVREAARLQTFPDNYHFKGGRTQQYVQVGNAVPPFLALMIAASLWRTIDSIAPRNSGNSKKKPGTKASPPRRSKQENNAHV